MNWSKINWNWGTNIRAMSNDKSFYAQLHSEDLQEVIAKPPSWLLSHGISVVILVVSLLFGLSFFIRYPELVRAEMKFTTSNSPKMVVNRMSGALTSILVEDGMEVKEGDAIAYTESTADHEQVIALLDKFKRIRNHDLDVEGIEDLIATNDLNIGELQGNYQAFYLSYLNYKAINKGGVLQKRREALLAEIDYIREQNSYILTSFDLQKQELQLAEDEFERYRTLEKRKTISPMELQQREALLLSKKQAIPQTERIIIANKSSLLSKQREVFEVENQIFEEKKKIAQALNSFISEAEHWKKQYVLTAPLSGTLVYGGFWQENQYFVAGERLFYINPNMDDYYGELYIPQTSISKVTVGQDVIIKVRSYPYHEYGYLMGEVSYISDFPLRDSVFFARIDLSDKSDSSSIRIKPGIFADAEIITDDQSLISRIWKNLIKAF